MRVLGCHAFAAALVAFAAHGSADDWPGWRGLDRQGVSASPQGPLHWSPESNVKWKTAIPGRGHSSPVVVGDGVVVTTAYHTRRGQGAKRLLADAAALLPLAVVLAAGVSLLGLGRRRVPLRSLVGLCCWACVAGVWCHFALAARLRLGTAVLVTEQRMEAWLLSSYAAALALLSCLPLAGRLTLVVLGAMGLGFAAAVLWARPLPGYFDLVTAGRMASEVYQALATALAAALVAFAAAALGGRTTEEKAKPRLAALPVLGAFALGVLGCGYPAALGLNRSVRGLVPEAIEGVPGGWVFASLKTPASVVGGLAVGVCIAGLVARAGKVPSRAVRWFPVAALCVAAFGFVERNFLFVTREFVRAVVCLDRATGRVRWRREGLAGAQPTLNRHNSPATPTPAVHDGRVFAWFGAAGLMCTGLDGKLLWTNATLPFDDIYGVSASPVVADGKVIIYSGQPPAPYLCALDPRTGKQLWRTALRRWPEREGQHRTPSVLSFRGKTLVVVWGWAGPKKEDLLRVFDAATGEKLWSHAIPACGETVTTIIADGSTLYLLSSDGLFAVSLERLAEGEDPVVWRGEARTKGQYVASPVLCGGRIFTVSNLRVASCFEASTGKLVWRQELAGRGCFASPAAVGSKVYFPDISGLVTVVSTDGEFRKLAENRLGEKLYASPAPVDGQLFLRTLGHLWCIEETPGGKK